jgi:hypothetical protein
MQMKFPSKVGVAVSIAGLLAMIIPAQASD